MKVSFFYIFLFFSSSVMGQSLKDSLFSGKLKNPLKQAEAAKDSAQKVAKDSFEITNTDSSTSLTSSSALAENNPVTNVQKPEEILPDSLNRLYYAKQKAWKRFIDQQTLIISVQADETRKVKKGEYYIELDYEIGLNGRVKVSNITCYPENEFLMATVTDAMTRTPVLAPPIYGDGKPRTILAKQQMTILKK
jgi:hypothetical protein